MKRGVRCTMMRVLAFVVFLATVLAVAAPRLASASDATEAQGIVDRAKATFNDFMADGNFSWLHDHLRKAKGLLIYPQVIKGGFFIGGAGGTGVLVVRKDDSDDWSNPAFYTVGSVTFGLQIGGEASEVIMMVMNDKAVNSLLSSSLKLGAGASIALGPIGAGAKGEVPADFIAFSRTKGLYAGLNLEGSLVEVRDSLNRAYYGKEVTPVDIVVKRSVSNPGAENLRTALKKGLK